MSNMMRRMVKESNPRISEGSRQEKNRIMNNDILGSMIQEAIPSGIMDSPIITGIKEGYNKVEPFIPEKITPEDGITGEFYGYELPSGPGILTFGADRGLDNFYGGYKFEFEEGGIVDTPQMKETIKKQLSDEQKDYLYDFMLDFMMKEKMREQQENEGRMPPFNYFDMEV